MIADVLRQARISQFCRQVPKLLEEITGCGGAGFDFNGVQIFAPVNAYINFKTAAFTIVVHVWLLAVVQLGFVEFGYNPGFENRPAQGVMS